MNSRTFQVLIEQEGDSFAASVPDLPVCVAVGESEEEVLALIKESIQFHLEGLQEEGLPVPKPNTKLTQVTV